MQEVVLKDSPNETKDPEGGCACWRWDNKMCVSMFLFIDYVFSYELIIILFCFSERKEENI